MTAKQGVEKGSNIIRFFLRYLFNFFRIYYSLQVVFQTFSLVSIFNSIFISNVL